MKNPIARSRGELVATVLRRSWRTDVTDPELSAEQLDCVTPLLYASGGSGLGWWRIRNTALAHTASGNVLHDGYRLQSLQIAMRQEQLERAFQLLDRLGVEAILMKGWAAARFYAEAGLRPHGDLDLLVRRTDHKAIKNLLDTPEGKACFIDLHMASEELDDRPIEDLFARSRVIKQGAAMVRVLSDEDHLALLTLHLLKHGAWRPLWLCDVAAVVEALSDDFDWNICLRSAKPRREWIKTTIALAHRLLDADLKQSRFDETSIRVPQWLIDCVLAQWGDSEALEHLPARPRPLMRDSMRDARTFVKEIFERWPDPITATFNLRRQINEMPRLPYQLGDFAFSAGRFVLEYFGLAARRA